MSLSLSRSWQWKPDEEEPTFHTLFPDLDPNGGLSSVKDQHEQLIQAMVKNDAFRVKALLHEEPGLVRAKDPGGRTPILFCLYFGHGDLASLIRELKPEPDITLDRPAFGCPVGRM